MVKIKSLVFVFVFSFIFFGFVSADTLISSCTNITTPGKYYLSGGMGVSSSSLPSPDACINILTPNVTIDCRGYNILKLDSVVYYIVKSNFYNTSVLNCNFVSSGRISSAILLNGANSSSISNVTLNGFIRGIYLNNTFSSLINRVTSINGHDSFYTVDSQNNNFSNFNITLSTSSSMIFLVRGSFNSFYNFTLTKTAGTSNPILFQYSNSNRFYNGIINSVPNYGIYVDFSNDNQFNSLSFNNSGGQIYSSYSSNLSIYDSNLTTLPNIISYISSIYMINSTGATLNSLNGNISIGWYLDLNVLDNQNAPLSNSIIQITNSSGSLINTLLTNVNGNAKSVLYESESRGGVVYTFGNYIVSVSKSGYVSSSQSTLMNGNKQLTFNLQTSGPTLYHPADNNPQNEVIDYNEVSSYVNGYLTGSYDLKNALYTITLRQNGGSYNEIGTTDCGASPWNCWN